MRYSGCPDDVISNNAMDLHDYARLYGRPLDNWLPNLSPFAVAYQTWPNYHRCTHVLSIITKPYTEAFGQSATLTGHRASEDRKPQALVSK